jgi:hypothetical protein
MIDAENPATYRAVHDVGVYETSRVKHSGKVKRYHKGKMLARKTRADYDRKLKAEFHKIPLCPTCKTNPRALSQSTCLPCKAEYMRERRTR